jgi:hypothetical protein
MNSLQTYLDAVAQVALCEFGLSTAKTAENSVRVPDVDEELWINFDDESFKLDRPTLNARIQAVDAAAAATELTLKDIRKVSDRVEYFLAEFEKIGVKGLDKTDLLLILFDAASVRDWGFVSPQMQALIDRLAPAPVIKK